ncbi:MAG TPA: hypothetical protein VMU11_02215 [Verrucomicrobiae bacterium]|nr:hypothetical protein [Verrucomicrobiae bacterium]
MANLDTLNRGELLQEISDLAREQGVTNQEDWSELVEEVIESHFDIGELNDDQDIQGTMQVLKDAWADYAGQSGEETPAQIDQDPEQAHL